MRRWALVTVAVSWALACSRPTLAPTAPAAQPNGHVTHEAAQKAERDLAAKPAPPAPKLEKVAPEVVAHGARSKKEIALTFDACSTRDTSQYDEAVTRVLLETKTPATIFLGGSWAKEEAAHVKVLAANPLFELENHTFTHPHMTAVKDDRRLREELARTQAEVHELTGQTPRYFRPPYGEYDQRVVKLAAEEGLTTVEYDLASGDPDVVHATKERLIEWVLRKAQPGSIIVMHINHLKFHTAEALPGIISGLRGKGYELVTVRQLIEDEHGQDAVAGKP